VQNCSGTNKSRRGFVQHVYGGAMLILSSADTKSLLDHDALRQAVASAMVELSAGRVSMPPRIAAYVKEGLFDPGDLVEIGELIDGSARPVIDESN
jgi:ornithine cyclodeaminase/alanine dehydrogenase-like protein (mu-crystallin family)